MTTYITKLRRAQLYATLSLAGVVRRQVTSQASTAEWRRERLRFARLCAAHARALQRAPR